MSPNIGAGEITVQHDTRVLAVGKVLRKSKLNELPQLWNIIIGEMSIVGPRPMTPATYASYSAKAQKKLNKVKPGLTGIGSIIFRDEEKYLAGIDDPMEFYKRNIIPYKSDLEIWFIQNYSSLLYIKIILVTAWVIIFPQSKIVDTVFKDLPDKPVILQ